VSFRDRAILVTGASRGIGAAIAKGLRGEGGIVIVNYRTNEAAAEAVVRNACSAARRWRSRPMSPHRGVAAMATRIAEEVGRLDVVVNNAFAPYRFDPDNRARFWETPWEAYEQQFEGAVKAAYTVSRAMLPLLQRRSGGSIVNLASDLVAASIPITTTPLPRRRSPASAATSRPNSARSASA
jgi:3-oxoacyl-[acyl-carrier protein] reductase